MIGPASVACAERRSGQRTSSVSAHCAYLSGQIFDTTASSLVLFFRGAARENRNQHVPALAGSSTSTECPCSRRCRATTIGRRSPRYCSATMKQKCNRLCCLKVASSTPSQTSRNRTDKKQPERPKDLRRPKTDRSGR